MSAPGVSGPDTAGPDTARPDTAALDALAVLHGEATERLTARVQRLTDVLADAAPVLDEALVARVDADLARVRERLALGVDRTVVAIVGGTGSGKSSLFNAVTRLQFADVGDLRPTTATPSACVWGPDGDALLDWLGIHRHRRIQRESLLDADDEAPLAGLVLVDLPDHDSVERAHRDVVDQVLPHVDLVLWVVDPQKYADDALHSGYLATSGGRRAPMVVVLNQLDTVPEAHRDELVADLRRLLAADGLTDAEVTAVSARTGEGVPGLRGRLAEVVAGASSAAAHAADEIDEVAAELAAGLGTLVSLPTAADLDAAVNDLTGAAGLDALGAAATSALRRGKAPSAATTVNEDAAQLARTRWLDRTTSRAPAAWVEAVATRVASPEELRLAVGDALDGLLRGVRPSRSARVLVWLGLAVVAVGAVLAVLGARGTGMGVVAGIAVAVVGFALTAVGWWWRRADAGRQGAELVRRGRAVVRAAAQARLADPTLDVLGRLDRLQHAALESGA